MLLLTWHGTILRVDQAQNRLTHAPLVPVRALARDLQVDLLLPLTAPARIGAGMELVPGSRPGTVHLHRGGLYVSINSAAAFLPCDHPEPVETDALLPLSDAEAADLRHLLANSWRHEDNAVSPQLAPGFKFCWADTSGDLTEHRPVLQPDGTMRVRLQTGVAVLAPLPMQPPAPEWHLRPAPTARICRAVEDDAAFQATADSRLTVTGKPETAIVPMAASRQDQDWFYRDPAHSPRAGRHTSRVELVHQANAFVLLHRSLEGTIVTAEGISAPGPLPAAKGPLPPGFSREAGELFLSTAALRGAPMLEGPHAVFYSNGITGYANWLLDALIPLCALNPHLPPQTILLLPSHLAETQPFDGLAALAAFGFDPAAAIMMPTGPCRVQHLYWPNHHGIAHIPADALNEARTHALNRLPAAAPDRVRIYIRRAGTRRITNMRAIEYRLKQNGFMFCTLEAMPFLEQMDLFRRAECVVGVHGGGLANLIFCQPGTGVIELAPESGYRPMFADISSKLGLVHAVLPCPPGEDALNGDLLVDGEKLGAVLRMLQQRL